MQDTPPGERTRLWGIPPVVLYWQFDVCCLLLWYLPCSLQHVPAKVSNASLLLNTHRHAQAHTLFVLCFIRKKGKKILQHLKKQARGLLKHKEESIHSFGLALSLTKEVSGEEEEAESRDMEEAEGELDGIPSNTATFCSEGQGTASTQQMVETKPSETASKNIMLVIIIMTFCPSHFLMSIPHENCWLCAYSQCSGSCLPAAPAVWCSCGCSFSCLQERKGAQEPSRWGLPRLHANRKPGSPCHRRG